MPSLNRSASLPVSNTNTNNASGQTSTSPISSLASTFVPNRILSRLKVFSGNAGRDEVSPDDARTIAQQQPTTTATTAATSTTASSSLPLLPQTNPSATPGYNGQTVVPSGILRVTSRTEPGSGSQGGIGGSTAGEDHAADLAEPIRETNHSEERGVGVTSLDLGQPVAGVEISAAVESGGTEETRCTQTGSGSFEDATHPEGATDGMQSATGGSPALGVTFTVGAKGDEGKGGLVSQERTIGKQALGGVLTNEGEDDTKGTLNSSVGLPPSPLSPSSRPCPSPLPSSTSPIPPIDQTVSRTSPGSNPTSPPTMTTAASPLSLPSMAAVSPYSPSVAPSTLAGSALGTIHEHETHEVGQGVIELTSIPAALSGGAVGTPSPNSRGRLLEDPPLLVLDPADDTSTIRESPGRTPSASPGRTPSVSPGRSPAGSISESFGSPSRSSSFSSLGMATPAVGIGGGSAQRQGRRLSASGSKLSSKALSVAGKLKAKITGGGGGSGSFNAPASENGYAALRRAASRTEANMEGGGGNSGTGSGPIAGAGTGSALGLPSIFGSLGQRNKSLKLGRSASLPADRATAGVLTSSFSSSDSRAALPPSLPVTSYPSPHVGTPTSPLSPSFVADDIDASPLILPTDVVTATTQQADELFKTGLARSAANRSSMGSVENVSSLSTSPNHSATSGLNSALAALGLKSGAMDYGSRGRGSRPDEGLKPDEAKSARMRSRSPFFSRGRKRIVNLDAIKSRENSPEGEPIAIGDDSDGESVVSNSSARFRPSAGSNFETKRPSSIVGSDVEDDSDESDDDDDNNDGRLSKEYTNEYGDIEDVFDETTEANTEANAVYTEGDASLLVNGDENEVELDVTGEGPNVVRLAEPDFPAPSQMRRPGQQAQAEASRRKLGQPERLDLVTGRPEYGRNNCTIRLTHGDPDEALERLGNRLRSYVVLSDLSQESNIAMTWALGTVARDGDEVFIINVMENEAKVDPKDSKDFDRAAKIRIQKERQTTALLLVKQVTGLLQRTQLNITVTCQAIHSKNARHMLLDLIDHIEPTMVIVGSRGLGKLKGIILGSTSRYLIEKSSVPVMVARRRLRAPLRKTDPATLRHAPRVSLASASIEKSASSKQEDDGLDAADIEAEEDEKIAAAARNGGRS